MPANIYLWLRMAAVALTKAVLDKSSRLSAVTRARHAHGLAGPVPIFGAYRKAERVMCPSLPELDFPMHVRPGTFGCGPLVLPARPVAELDPDLAAWLARDGFRTVLVNLGTHYRMNRPLARAVARALNGLLAAFADIQVLWKVILDKGGSGEGEGEGDGGEGRRPPPLEDLAGLFDPAFRDSDRIRMQTWLEPDPVALLETGRIAAQVHHGGANTYFECCR